MGCYRCYNNDIIAIWHPSVPLSLREGAFQYGARQIPEKVDWNAEKGRHHRMVGPKESEYARTFR